MTTSRNDLDPSLKPHEAIDLTDQNMIFLLLEELGVAHMQHAWVSEHEPKNPDLTALAAQAWEFFIDSCGILMGRAGADRVKPNDWAGARLADHLRSAIGAEVTHFAQTPAEEASDEAVIASALTAYLKSLDKLTALQQAEAAAGREFGPKHYIDMMAVWSGVFAGTKSDLSELDARLLPL